MIEVEIKSPDEQWCDLVEKAARMMRPNTFDSWLRSVGDGDDSLRVKKGLRLLDVFAPAALQPTTKLTVKREP